MLNEKLLYSHWDCHSCLRILFPQINYPPSPNSFQFLFKSLIIFREKDPEATIHEITNRLSGIQHIHVPVLSGTSTSSPKLFQSFPLLLVASDQSEKFQAGKWFTNRPIPPPSATAYNDCHCSARQENLLCTSLS